MTAARRPLRGGDVVQVRSETELLATLGADGTLDGLPLMPEMLATCGQTFTVESRADTTCFYASLLDMDAAVHLTGAHCDGSAHGGCQANCFFFFKEEWLEPVVAPGAQLRAPQVRAGGNRAVLEAAVRQPGSPTGGPDERWSCQNTELRSAAKRIQHWDLRHFIRDVRRHTVSWWDVVRTFVPYVFDTYQAVSRRRFPRRLQINRGAALPAVHGTLTRTPVHQLNLQPGERVRVRDRAEIRSTVDASGRNRGLSFDVEMTPYCGQTRTVQRRVSRVIDDWTGEMLELGTECIVLEGAVCRGRYHGLCTRKTDTYWREIWLEREPTDQAPTPSERRNHP